MQKQPREDGGSAEKGGKEGHPFFQAIQPTPPQVVWLLFVSRS